MSASILHDPELKFVFSPDDTPVEVDVSCYTLAVELSSDAETIDIGTFCQPSASEVGRVTEECTCVFLWEPALYTALQPHIGEEFELQLKVAAADTEGITFRGRYAALPWGRFEVGQRVEADLQVAVLTSIQHGTIV